VDVGNIAKVSEAHAASIFRGKVGGWWLSFCVCIDLCLKNPVSKNWRLVATSGPGKLYSESAGPFKGQGMNQETIGNWCSWVVLD
jgi:hypothetical protein